MSSFKMWVKKYPGGIRQFILAVSIMLLLVAIFTFGLSIFKVMAGFHAVDLTYDAKYLINDLGGNISDYMECNLDGVCFSLSQTYRDGWIMLFNGVYLAIFTATIIPLLIFLIVNLSQRGKK